MKSRGKRKDFLQYKNINRLYVIVFINLYFLNSAHILLIKTCFPAIAGGGFFIGE